MEIEFKSTCYQYADRLMQMALDNPDYQSIKKQRSIGVFVLYFSTLLFVYIMTDATELWIITLIPIIITSIFYCFYDRYWRRVLLKEAVKERGTKEPLEAIYEATDEKLIFKMQEYEAEVNWDTMYQIKDHGRFFAVSFHEDIMAVFHPEIFADDKQRLEWLEFINKKYREVSSES